MTSIDTVSLNCVSANVNTFSINSQNNESFVIKNEEETDTHNGRTSSMLFSGITSNKREHSLAKIESSHIGTGNDFLGNLNFYVNNNSTDKADFLAMQLSYSDILEFGKTPLGGTLSLIVLQDDSNANNDFYKNYMVQLVNVDGSKEERIITSYDGDTNIANVTPDFTLAPDETFKYNIFKALVTIHGDLQVNNMVSSTNTHIRDSLIKLGRTDNTNLTPTHDMGLVFSRGDENDSDKANKGIIWDETADIFSFIGCNTETGTTNGNVTIDSYESVRCSTLQVGNSGIKISDGSHNLILATAEDLDTSDKTITFTTGNANRGITLGGDLNIVGNLTTKNLYNSLFIGNNPTNLLNTAINNVSVGTTALNSITTGNNNTCIGFNSGNTITTGEKNICIGSDSAVSSNNANNQIVIGCGAACQSDNEISLGNEDIHTLRCSTSVIASLSDKRDKTEIIDSKYGLDFLNKIKPRQFKWKKRILNDSDKHFSKEGTLEIGFIAQEIQDVINGDENDILNLIYDKNPARLEIKSANLIPILVKAIKDLSEKVNILESNLFNLNLKK